MVSTSYPNHDQESVKDFKRRQATREAPCYFGGRKRNFKAIGHLTSQKIVRNVGLPLVKQFLAQGYALVRILSALKVKPSTYYNWRHWQPSRQEKRRESLKPYILDVWKTFKFYGYRRIAAYSQQTDGPKVSEYMTLKLMRELGIKSRMQKRYRKPKTVVTVDQKPNLIRHLHDLSGVWQTDITYIQQMGLFSDRFGS
ncbi:IS3 family transposase (plasmid) [Weissella confusa]|nr:IS3 family transposase [Weissella confusa]WEY49452.1 IS3 family transposase [Weissella confusa]